MRTAVTASETNMRQHGGKYVTDLKAWELPRLEDLAQRVIEDLLAKQPRGLDESGRPAFQVLQHRDSHAKHQIVFYAFDVLHIDGRDVIAEPIEKRRALLPRIVASNPVIRISADLAGAASQVIEAVRSLGLEGVIAKRRGSIYQPGDRSIGWLKLRSDRQQEFVIGGFRPDGATIDALLVGYTKARDSSSPVRCARDSHRTFAARFGCNSTRCAPTSVRSWICPQESHAGERESLRRRCTRWCGRAPSWSHRSASWNGLRRGGCGTRRSLVCGWTSRRRK
jgi:ATP dependent DNA ligase domain